MDTLFIFFLNHSFLDKVKNNNKKTFLLILNGAQNFKFFGFLYKTLIG